MESLIGKKVKGFKFVGNYGGSTMDKYIGQIGIIDRVIDEFVKVIFNDGEYWIYPLLEIEKHLVNEYPKIMTVSNCEDLSFSETRVVFMGKNGKFLSWVNAETIEDAENETEVVTWSFAKDIEQKTIIERGTFVYYTDLEYSLWKFGFYDEFKNNSHYVFQNQQKEGNSNPWKYCQTENPLI